MRPTFRLVSDFILPHLNRSTYGTHLQWEDRENGSFKISRIHQSSEMWNEQCIEVYKAWSIKKKLWQSNDPKKITKAKHRLITALRRNPEIEMLKKESLYYRFKIVHQNGSGNRLHQGTVNQLKVITESRENREEIEKHTMINDRNKINDFKSVFDFNKVENAYFAFSDTNTNIEHWPAQQPNPYDVQKEFPVTDDILGDVEEPKSTVNSDKCCCEKLLDNYLCNQKCIWHGMPT